MRLRRGRRCPRRSPTPPNRRRHETAPVGRAPIAKRGATCPRHPRRTPTGAAFRRATGHRAVPTLGGAPTKASTGEGKVPPCVSSVRGGGNARPSGEGNSIKWHGAFKPRSANWPSERKRAPSPLRASTKVALAKICPPCAASHTRAARCKSSPAKAAFKGQTVRRSASQSARAKGCQQRAPPSTRAIGTRNRARRGRPGNTANSESAARPRRAVRPPPRTPDARPNGALEAPRCKPRRALRASASSLRCRITTARVAAARGVGCPRPVQSVRALSIRPSAMQCQRQRAFRQ